MGALQRSWSRRTPADTRLSSRSSGPVQSLKVFYVGQLPFGSTSESRRVALQSLVGKIDAFDVYPSITPHDLGDQILTNHLYLGRRISEINRLIQAKALESRPDVLWVDRGLQIWPETLEAVRRSGCDRLIHFSPDNHMILGNQSRFYFQTIPYYDVHITTKTANIDWLQRCGARKVELIGKAFDPAIHRPLALEAADRLLYGCDIGFVGHWEPSREKTLMSLQRKGYRIKVWGGGWRKAREAKHPLFADSRHLIGDDYAKAIGGAKINLCLLSGWFQDQTTAR